MHFALASLRGARVAALVALATGLVACSSGSPSGTSPSVQEDNPGSPPVCATGEARIDGNGFHPDLTVAVTSGVSVASSQSSFSLRFGEDDLELTWSSSPPPTNNSAPGIGTLRVGTTTYCARQGTLVEPSTGGGVFVLQLSPQSGGTCPAREPATFWVRGCWSSS
jgi:hypothetical protein